MANQEVDQSKRRFLVAATTAMGGVATVAVAVPFVMSMLPSERAKAAGAPVEIDIGKVEQGSMIIVEWRSKPVWIINRTQGMLDLLGKIDGKLTDPGLDVPQQPGYCRNATRSIKPNLMVLVGICTHLGCSPTPKLQAAEEGMGSDWPGGFFCPCHGSRFDLAGRVFKGSPAPINLQVPPYKYLTDTRLLIGIGQDGKEA
ncbi:ubiquinol-cytochrome c reductase iron-sulfur subunit [mine drainage metagenome]|uniref:Ubiquinol-cytochrome c reductase iron-sulfur subunit n=1 Tax=mine drainage metagenome TaxID=410659 RepID=A0A1J5QRT6_9ZZZZ